MKNGIGAWTLLYEVEKALKAMKTFTKWLRKMGAIRCCLER